MASYLTELDERKQELELDPSYVGVSLEKGI